jgi:hypothetical protein
MIRISGLYWIGYNNKNLIGEWTGQYWLISTYEGKRFSDDDFSYIDPEVLTKEKYDLMQAGYTMLNAFKKASIAYEYFIKLNKK